MLATSIIFPRPLLVSGSPFLLPLSKRVPLLKIRLPRPSGETPKFCDYFFFFRIFFRIFLGPGTHSDGFASNLRSKSINFHPISSILGMFRAIFDFSDFFGIDFPGIYSGGFLGGNGPEVGPFGINI